MAATIQRDVTRRSGSTAVEPPKEKPIPLTWEEEELAAYEPKRAKAVEEQRIANEKLELLQRQLPFQWKALGEILKIRCESINARAARMILRAVEINRNHLEFNREDGMKFDVRFDPDNKKIMFTGKVLGYDREYELIVQSFDGVHSTAWFSPTTLATEQPDDLAKSMIGYLLRAEQ